MPGFGEEDRFNCFRRVSNPCPCYEHCFFALELRVPAIWRMGCVLKSSRAADYIRYVDLFAEDLASRYRWYCFYIVITT